jgi:hypothetical protein
MSSFIDIAGQRFGRLTVVACAGRTKRGNTIWTCRCDCGNEKIVQASHLPRCDDPFDGPGPRHYRAGASRRARSERLCEGAVQAVSPVAQPSSRSDS